MKRIILIALALMLAGGAGRATAMNLLRCKDKGVTGFDVRVWESVNSSHAFPAHGAGDLDSQ